MPIISTQKRGNAERNYQRTPTVTQACAPNANEHTINLSPKKQRNTKLEYNGDIRAQLCMITGTRSVKCEINTVLQPKESVLWVTVSGCKCICHGFLVHKV